MSPSDLPPLPPQCATCDILRKGRRAEEEEEQEEEEEEVIPFPSSETVLILNSIVHFVRVLTCFLTPKRALLSKTSCDDVTFQTNSRPRPRDPREGKGKRASEVEGRKVY